MVGFFFSDDLFEKFIVIHFVDSAAGESDKAKAAFGENYPRLQGIKKKYDPDNIFNKWFPITPA
jgi:FAD/FMN-containing dehydrogenase